MTRHFFIQLQAGVLLLAGFFHGTASLGQGIEPYVLDDRVDSFYRPQIYYLDNGMRVVLKPRSEVQKVSLRLVVDIGMDHFECSRSELPHVIEHMLFEGTEGYTNNQLEQRVADHGASWNATTDLLVTTYEFEVYGAYLDFALDTLYDMLSASLMDEAAMERAIDAAWIESDNSDGVKRFWDSLSIGANGSDRLFDAMGVYCEGDEDPYSFTYSELLETFEGFYRPDNMSLVLVGNFEPQQVREMLAARFGHLHGHPSAPAENRFRWREPDQARYESGPLLEFSDASATGIVWLTGGFRGPEYASLQLLKQYLGTRLYTLLRNDYQLSYTPFADSIMSESQGVFYLEADTQWGNEERVLGLMRGELEQLLEQGLSDEEFNRLQQSLVIASAMQDLDNATMANYYAGSLFELKDSEAFWNYERKIMELDRQTFQQTLGQFFEARQGVEFIDRTSFDSRTLMAVYFGLAGVLLSAIGIAIYRRRRQA